MVEIKTQRFALPPDLLDRVIRPNGGFTVPRLSNGTRLTPLDNCNVDSSSNFTLVCKSFH